MKQLIYAFGLFIAAFIFCGAASAQIITTVAGGGTNYVGDGGPATACLLYNPVGIVFDTAGNYYITSRGESRIRKVAPDGIITTIAGDTLVGFSGDGGPATDAELAGPYGIAIDVTGNIYFADNANNRIRKISTAGIITTIAGTGVGGYNGDSIPATNAELYGPSGIAVDNSGNIYVADNSNNRVRKISTAGIITTIAGTGVMGYNGDNIPATAAELHYPNWVALDLTGNLYIADEYNDRIRMIDTSGIIHTFAGSSSGGYSGDNGAATAAKLAAPLGVYADNLGNVYIGDTYNWRIRKVDAAGIITTIAGDGIQGDSGDGGEAILAELNGPVGIATDAAYNIYFADDGNHRVRMITSTLKVTSPTVTQAEVLLFPNPSDGNFTINISTEINENATVTLYDLFGRIIKTINATTNAPHYISIDAVAGVYLLTARTSAGVWTKKIVVAK